MKNKNIDTDTFDFSSCPCVESVGQCAVYVSADCQNLHIIKGKLVTTKGECRKCSGREKAYRI